MNASKKGWRNFLNVLLCYGNLWKSSIASVRNQARPDYTTQRHYRINFKGPSHSLVFSVWSAWRNDRPFPLPFNPSFSRFSLFLSPAVIPNFPLSVTETLERNCIEFMGQAAESTPPPFSTFNTLPDVETRIQQTKQKVKKVYDVSKKDCFRNES